MLKKDYCSTNKQLKPEYKVREDVRLQRRKSFLKKMVLFFSILFLIVFIIHSLFFSSFFKIKKIIITGLNLIEEREAKQITQEFFNYQRYVLFSQQNIFFLNQTALKNTLNRRFDLEATEIKVAWPSALKIEVKKNAPIIILMANKKYFSVYQNGAVAKEIIDISGYELPLIKTGTTIEVVLGQTYFTESQIAVVKSIFSHFKTYFKNQEIDYFEIMSPDSKDIKLVVKEKWYLLFNIDLDMEESLKLASRVIGEKIKETAKLQYLDLRVKDRVYYK